MSFFYITDDVAPAGVGGGAHGDVALLVASGEIDYAAAPQLRQRILDHIHSDRRRLLVDLSTVTFIDSTAIGVLVGAAGELQDAGDGSLTIICAEENTRVRRIFDIAGVDNLVTVHSSRGQALSELASAG